MYDLGDQFKFDLNKSMPNKESTFEGNKYRITVLTERLVRLEYNEDGIFENFPTELIWYRNFSKPDFTMSESKNTLKISTKYFELNYNKETNFKGSKINPSKNLKITLCNTNKVWYYGHPEVRNYGICINEKEVKSLYSLDGFASIDDSKSLLMLENGSFKSRDSKGIDIYVFLYNKDFYLCLNDYFKVSGYPPLIPRYALGNWWSKDSFYDEFQISHVINKFEFNNIPISLFILNKWEFNNDYIFSENYKNPSLISNYLNKKNIKFGLSIEDPILFKANTNIFDKLKKYLVKDSNGNIPFNMLDAKTIDAYLKIIIHPLKSYNVDFYSINSKESDRSFLLKHYLYYNNLLDVTKRPIISSNNSIIAAHRYPIFYSDHSLVSWETLKNISKLNNSMTNLGMSYNSYDIGGYSGGVEDGELFTRYVQLGVFSPIVRLSSDSSKYYKREPWKWDIETSTITTKYLNLRYKLIPYIYTEAYKYFKYGKPLIEPIYYRYPILYDDLDYCNEYFFGSSFLVSPILKKEDLIMNRVIQRLYIPDGVWYDFFTGKKYIGGKKYVSFYKNEEYPIFVKAGTIIPMSNNTFNDTSVPSKLELQVFPGDNNTYSIYEDDGVTNNHLNGEYLITNVEFIYEENNYKLTILPVEGKVGVLPKTRDYKIRFKNTNLASKILSYVGSTQVRNHGYIEDTDLIIEIDDVPTNSQLTLVCSGNNMEIAAIRIIKDDIVSIISDLPIKTIIKDKIDSIIFSNELTLKKKRIAIKKLAHGKDFLEQKYIQLFLKLLEYIQEI